MMVSLVVCCVATADQVDDQALIAQVARERSGPPATDATARNTADLSRAEQEARIDLALAQSRLELVLARKALRTNQVRDAAIRAQRVLDLLKELPQDVDASELELQAEGILARAEKAGVDTTRLAEPTSAEAPLGSDDYLDGQSRAAAEVARRYTGADRDTIDTRADAHTLRQRTLRRQRPDDYGYRPGKEIFDVDTILERDRQRLYYEDALRKSYSADAARLLTEADETRVVPVGEVAYPDDWPEKTVRRAKYADGEIARSQSWIDEDGREWYVAIYDINDLTINPPRVDPVFSLDLNENTQYALDRHALRWGWGAYNWGWGPFQYWDPWYTGPLYSPACYFGGAYGLGWHQPLHSAERQEQIVEMIKAFTMRSTESQIISLPPQE
jgi:hypothetical protein